MICLQNLTLSEMHVARDFIFLHVILTKFHVCFIYVLITFLKV